MPDQVYTPDAAPQPGTEPQKPAAPAQTTAPAFTMPEKFAGKSVEDVARSYTELESQHGKVADMAKQIEQYGGLENVKQWLAYANQTYQQSLAAQQQAQNQPQQQQQQAPAGDPFENWDMLSPKEQAGKLAQLVAGAATQYINQYGTQIVTAYQRQIADQLGGLNKQWEIYRNVMAQWRKNPNIDPDALLQSMAKVATGDLNSLIDIASKQLTGQADFDARVSAEVQRRIADQRLHAENQQVNVLTNAGRSSFTPTEAPKTHDDATRMILDKLVKSGEFTPGHF